MIENRVFKDVTKFIFIKDELKPVDIIFIPGGSHPELGEYAAELYKKGLAKWVMPSGGVSIKTGKFAGVRSKADIYKKDYKSDYEFLEDVLLKNGVPKEAIVKEDKSSFTKENAFFSKKVLDEIGIKVETAIICCKSFHARRTLMCYQFAFQEVEILVNPIPYFEKGIEITAENWHRSEIGIKRVLGELERCGNQFCDEFYKLRGDADNEPN